jgi:hypothetical protein
MTFPLVAAALLLARTSSGMIGIEDYPPDALRQHGEGTAAVSLDIDETGRATCCRVVRSRLREPGRRDLPPAHRPRPPG